MPVMHPCDNCGRPTPIYRLASVVLDGHVGRLCPSCASTQRDRVRLPYAPQHDQDAIQPSTPRTTW